jgi:hypothetical protein
MSLFSLVPALVLMAPVAPSPSAPGQDRDIGFAGFNLTPLKGSVLPAEGPLFAVLVAGSGPTDRNWSNPMLPKGQAGKDFALWLQGQGVASLRFDKRFIGSQNPKLDISLDAQLGDIRAALKAARSLPEAKGKKLLLIGHSEGALLGMMAASDTDALLLIGLPAQSMGQTILAQLRLQLPPLTAAANLGYMEKAFEAIRKGRPAPEGSPEVYPQIVTLAKNLMRTESLDFVRSTLDLDPWTLAARISVPCALAWGDRDVQTWKPERVPNTFKGAIIDLPETNHLLRKESRSRAELNGSNAGSGYGGDTPMADLGALAAWLKGILREP